MADRLERLESALGGSYRIEREIGVGGMATVYLAHDVKHDRKVALKVLRPELAAAMGTDRFPREIHIIAQLQHPHIVPLYDSGEMGGFLYYVMPFIEGESLRARLERVGPLPVHDAVRVLHEIADALAYAHARGIVHRDIKPDNVMLSGRHAAVTDFGVAKAVSASAGDRLTTVGIAVGTPQYMAPEQAMAEANIDHRADIYALGVLGYEMLTGKPAFEATTAQGMLSAHVLEQPKDVRDRRADVPPLLAETLLKCLAKDPADRWQSADELSARLELIATTPSGGITPTTTRPVTGTAARPPATGRRRWIGLAALVLLAAAGLATWRLGFGHGGIQRIGVLPIEDISGQDAVFVDAMHDALTNALSRLGAVGVAPRSAILSYRRTPKTTKEIAKDLDLDAVVEATVFRAGNVMRINVQFEDPVTTRSLWSETFERDVRDVLAAQNDIVTRAAAGVASALGIAGPKPRAGESK
ncbi:MAG TPA: serine/threonine-protein kinase [Gemmatimonadales bacterium]|jgi:serine/threonine-protein kinase|nr:serine/threonine-protein kinase [Gemmatimonadales bacterium]